MLVFSLWLSFARSFSNLGISAVPFYADFLFSVFLNCPTYKYITGLYWLQSRKICIASGSRIMQVTPKWPASLSWVTCTVRFLCECFWKRLKQECLCFLPSFDCCGRLVNDTSLKRDFSKAERILTHRG